MYCAKHNAEQPSDQYRLKVFIGRNIPDEKRRILSELLAPLRNAEALAILAARDGRIASE